MIFWLATTNSHKVKEIKDFFENSPDLLSGLPLGLPPGLPPGLLPGLRAAFSDLIIKTPVNLKNYRAPEETGRSFQENAGIKSRHLLSLLKNSPAENSGPKSGDPENKTISKTDIWILGEDSGLEAKALKGAPGIRSARYSGPQATDHKNNLLLLENLKEEVSREARYVCAISRVSALSGEERVFQGFCEGSIAFEERGKNGFGYDPLFIPQGESQTLGELPAEFKREISHRAKALRQLAESFLSP